MTKLLFVCHGNICRSTMGGQVARAWIDRDALAIDVDSAGVSDEEHGNPIDPRAARVLREHGYPTGSHRAQQVTAAMIADADLVLGFEPHHVQRMRHLAPGADDIKLVTDFDPAAVPGSGIADPWYGDRSSFEETLSAIEAAMPGILTALG